MNELYILNTKTSINFKNPAKNEYWEDREVDYIVEKNGKLRCVSSYGSLEGFELGGTCKMIADQSNKTIGYGTIVGIVTSGDTEGVVPEKSVPYWVCK